MTTGTISTINFTKDMFAIEMTINVSAINSTENMFAIERQSELPQKLKCTYSIKTD